MEFKKTSVLSLSADVTLR